MEEKKTVEAMERIDASHAPVLEEMLLKAVEEPENNHIIIDMEHTVYICSVGLRVLLTIQKKLRRRGGTMVIKNVKPQIMEIFDVTGFSGILTFE